MEFGVLLSVRDYWYFSGHTRLMVGSFGQLVWLLAEGALLDLAA